MSVDTKALRNEAQEIWTTKWASTITMLCDEIDRLREQYNKLLEESKKMSVGFLRQGEEIEELRKEVKRKDIQLENMKDLLRPRSIKDEPPPTCKNILVWSEQSRAWVNHHYLLGITASSRGDKCWMPEPPAPPQPNEFGEWAESVDPKMNLEEMRAARLAWNAAIQSTKKQP